MDNPFWKVAETPTSVDEFVTYELFPDLADVERAKKVCGSGGEISLSTYMGALRLAVIEKVRLLAKGYLWHNDAFALYPFKEQARRTPSLKGVVTFGDGLEDEWFVTYLLMQVSKDFPELIIRLWDSDGEFLLIEAAEHLPAWLEPDTSTNRVFIRAGKVYIINPSDLSSPKLEDSLAFIRRDPKRGVASASIQRAIQERIGTFEGDGQLLHHHRILVPRKLAVVLQKHPPLISLFLQTLFNRGPGDLTKASSLTSLKQPNGALDLVFMRSALTRTQFAQLLCQSIAPPRGYPVPGEGSSDHLACMLGMKLALAAQLSLLKNPSYLPKSKALAMNVEEGELLRSYFKVVSDHVERSSTEEALTVSELFASIKDDVVIRDGPDDDLSWLNIDGGEVINSISAKFQGIQLSNQDQDEVVNKMLAEEELADANANANEDDEDEDENGGAKFKHLDKFMDFQSGLEGIEYNELDVTNSDQEDEEHWDAPSSLDEDESNEELLHHEILEAIVHDPELLMKLLERSEEFGLDTKELLLQVQRMKEQLEPQRSKSSSWPQKGITDIDPAKVLAARTRSRDATSMSTIVSTEGLSEKSSSDDEDIDKVLYSRTLKPPKLREEITDDLPSDDSDGEAPMRKVMEAMDDELASVAGDRNIINPEKELKRALAADKSPARSILLSLQR